MSKLRNCLLVFISLWLCSCSKTPLSNGVVIEENRRVAGHFRVLEMNDNVNVRLSRHLGTASDSTRLHIEANEHLIGNITTEIHGDTLTIGNSTALNWTRPYDCTLDVTLYYDSISIILFNSNGSLNSDVLHGWTQQIIDNNPDTGDTTITHKRQLNLVVNGGSGDINLNMDCDQLVTNYHLGTSAITLQGDVGIAYTSTSYNCHGPIDAQNMETNYHYVYSYGTNSVTVKAFTEIQGSNFNNGVIRYVRYHATRTEKIWGHFNENNVYIPQHDTIVTYSCPRHIIYNGPTPDSMIGLDSIVLN